MTKGLEALAKISSDFDEVLSVDEEGMPNFIGNRLEQNYVDEMAIIRKELKALEIVNAKNVQIYDLKNMCLEHKVDALKWYNSDCCRLRSDFLNEEEFDLLCEVFPVGDFRGMRR